MLVTLPKTQREFFLEKLSMFRELIPKFEQMNNQKWSTYTRTRQTIFKIKYARKYKKSKIRKISC